MIVRGSQSVVQVKSMHMCTVNDMEHNVRDAADPSVNTLDPLILALPS